MTYDISTTSVFLGGVPKVRVKFGGKGNISFFFKMNSPQHSVVRMEGGSVIYFYEG